MNFVGIFKQQDLEADDQFKVFAKGLVSIFTLAANKYGSHGLPAVQSLQHTRSVLLRGQTPRASGSHPLQR